MDCRRAKDEWWHTKCEEFETLQSQHTREMHETIKEVAGQGHIQKGSNCIKDKNRNMLFDENEIKQIWEEYVTTLYNDTRANPPDVMNDEGEEIMLSEVEQAIKDLKDKKEPGKDDITAEMIKALNNCTIPIAHRLEVTFTSLVTSPKK